LLAAFESAEAKKTEDKLSDGKKPEKATGS
jgi:hypothetical protein